MLGEHAAQSDLFRAQRVHAGEVEGIFLLWNLWKRTDMRKQARWIAGALALMLAVPAAAQDRPA